MSIVIEFHINNNMEVLIIITIQLFDLQNLQYKFDGLTWLQNRIRKYIAQKRFVINIQKLFIFDMYPFSFSVL